MTIRPQRPADLPALLDLWLQGNLDAHPFIPAAYWEENRPAVAAALPEAEVLAAEEAGSSSASSAFRGTTSPASLSAGTAGGEGWAVPSSPPPGPPVRP